MSEHKNTNRLTITQTTSLQDRILSVLIVSFLILCFVAGSILFWMVAQARTTSTLIEQQISTVVSTGQILQIIDQPRVILGNMLLMQTYDGERFASDESAYRESIVQILRYTQDFTSLDQSLFFNPTDEQFAAQSRIEEVVTDFDRYALQAMSVHKAYLTDPDSHNANTLRAIRVYEQLATDRHSEMRLLIVDALNRYQENALLIIDQRLDRQNIFYLSGTSIFFACVVLLLGVLFAVMRLSVFQPLSQITQTAERIVQGKHLIEIPLTERSDEVGLLARAFALSIDRLRKNAQELESQVKERTHSLHDKNAELERIVQDLNRTTKQLIRRDLDLTQANERLKELDSVKTEFVSVAAHQLRTPLTAIRWTFQALKNITTLSPDEKQLVSNANKATNNLIVLVNDLLNVARIDEERFELDRKSHQVTELLAGICEEYKADAKHKGVRFVIDFDADLPIFSFDWEKMDMVIRNLLSNAIKYTETGGDVMLVVRREGEELIMEVTDSGIGIPEHQKSRIFSKFFRADNALLHQTNGSGLGLYVTKSIIEAHGGTITLKSKEGIGTTFTVRLPIDRRT